MSSLADRLRGVVTEHVGRTLSRPPDEPDRARPTVSSDAAETLGGEWCELRGQRFMVIDRKYPPGHRHGRVAVADTLPPEDSCWSRFAMLDRPGTNAPSGRMLFIDLETTGLAGGAGTYAFLVGCAWYQDGSLRVRQFFLSNFAAERVLLEAVAQMAERYGAVVTFNGKSFDLPLIETRFQLHRLETPFAGMPHVDMLHPARRLWSPLEGDEPDSPEPRSGDGRVLPKPRNGDGRVAPKPRSGDGRVSPKPRSGDGRVSPKPRSGEGGCRLGVLEGNLCGHVREGDVPGFEIPSRYFHFVRTGDARGLAAVMEHNRLDLVSLAMLTACASQLLEDGPPAARTSREALGMGRLYERAGMTIEARASFLRAAEHREADTVTRAEAWRSYAVLSRRDRRFTDAADAWRRILELRRCPPAILREATEALAVHHEHRARDLETARTFALQSLNLNVTRAHQEATQHRLARLNRKLGSLHHEGPGHDGHEEPQRELFSL